MVAVFQKAERQVPVAVHAADVVVNHAVQNLKKFSALRQPARQKGSYSGLDHNRDYAAFESVACHIADPEKNALAFRDHVEVVAATSAAGSIDPEMSRFAIPHRSSLRGSIICCSRFVISSSPLIREFSRVSP